MQIYERFLELFKSIKTGCNGDGPPKNKAGKKGNTLPLPLYYLQKKKGSVNRFTLPFSVRTNRN
jgi:hypothetical protein